MCGKPPTRSRTMTVSTEVNQAAYTGNGVTTVFPYTFRILNSANLTVTRIDLLEVETVLVLGTDYTVTGAGSYNGGSVTLINPLPNGYGLIIERDLSAVQETDLRNQGTFFAEVHEDVFDYLTMLIQQALGWVGLALKRPNSRSSFYDAKQYRIANIADPINAQDAVNNRTLLQSLADFSTDGSGQFVLQMLASHSVSLGASLVGLKSGGTVQDAINYITLEMMHAASDDEALAAAIALQRDTGLPILLAWKAYTITSPKVYSELFDVTIIGMGKGRSVLNLTHLDQGLRFGPESDAGTRKKITLKGFTINRVNYASYAGTIGPKNLYMSNRDNIFIEDVEVIGNIGYGIQTDYSENILINHCSVKNAVGGYLTQRGGTDGIHLYRSKRGRVSNCFASNLGDDGFSCGSFNPSYPATDIVFENNTIYQCAGGFKAYSLVANVKYQKNTIDTALQGAFYLTNDANNINGSYVKNISINNNFIVNAQDLTNLTNIESGALRIRQWPDNGVANATSQIDNVVFNGNIIETSGVIASHVTTDDNKRISNLFINDNFMRSPAQINSTNRPAIRLIQCDYGLEICRNNFSGLMFGAVAIDFEYSGFFSQGSASPRWKISDNIIRGYNIGQAALGVTNAYRAIFLRESGYHINLEMTGNKISDCTVSDAVPPTQAVFTGTVSPLSFIEANTADGSMSISGGNGAYKGIIKYLVGTPSAGTHYKNSHVQTQDPTTALLDDYICYKDGTYGALSSVTATTTAGSRVITVSSTAGLYLGVVISVTGVSGTFIVRNMNGNTLVLNAACDSSVSGADVAYSAPTWRRLSWSTSTPASSSV